MSFVGDNFIRQQLATRLERLQAASARTGRTQEIEELVTQVDAAIQRLETGTFGVCEKCLGTVEAGRLIADPMVRFCLDCLTAPEQRQLEADLEMAARIQRALLPPERLSVHGWEIHYHYEPVGMVSGDYCDLIVANPSDGGLFFLLGDVSGKGVAASLLMAHLHAMFRSLVTFSQPLERMMQVANGVFCESTIPGQFATLVCGRADRSGRLELSSAGHPPGLVVGRGGVSRAESAGFPLGMFRDARYTTQTFELQTGDALLLYSDGVTESRNASGEEYGVERLACFMENRQGTPSADLVRACQDDLRAFSGGTRGTDDVTLMALRRAA
jgi:sigma-B regulation protein RsbU (phosphoserine phosphatase)